MRKEFAPFSGWIGEWTGKGETLKGVPVITRMVLRPRLAEEVLEFEIVSQHAETDALVHGVVALMTVDPDGQLRMAVCSTIHGCIVMRLTPEDPGAAAIAGTSVTGNHVVVSLIEDNSGLMLTSYWKKDEPKAEPIGHTNIKLKRVARA